jgi:hypothetical protein
MTATDTELQAKIEQLEDALHELALLGDQVKHDLPAAKRAQFNDALSNAYRAAPERLKPPSPDRPFTILTLATIGQLDGGELGKKFVSEMVSINDDIRRRTHVDGKSYGQRALPILLTFEPVIVKQAGEWIAESISVGGHLGPVKYPNAKFNPTRMKAFRDGSFAFNDDGGNGEVDESVMALPLGR